MFKADDGTIDTTLILALGGTLTKDGKYTISVAALQNRLYAMDLDRDGIVTKEEVEQYRQSSYYKFFEEHK